MLYSYSILGDETGKLYPIGRHNWSLDDRLCDINAPTMLTLTACGEEKISSLVQMGLVSLWATDVIWKLIVKTDLMKRIVERWFFQMIMKRLWHLNIRLVDKELMIRCQSFLAWTFWALIRLIQSTWWLRKSFLKGSGTLDLRTLDLQKLDLRSDIRPFDVRPSGY